MNYVIINGIFLFFINYSTLAQESKCYDLVLQSFEKTDAAQYEIQKEIKSHLEKSSAWHIIHRLTTQDSSLKPGLRSNNLCKCILSHMTNKERNYDYFPNVFGVPDQISVRVNQFVYHGIPIIKCQDPIASIEYSPWIMKGNKGTFLSGTIYDIYLLSKGEGDQYEYVWDGVISDVNLEIFKQPTVSK